MQPREDRFVDCGRVALPAEAHRDSASDWSNEQDEKSTKTWSPKWKRKKDASVSLRPMVIGLGIVRNQPWMMGCAKNAMKRTVRRRQILMGPDRATNEVVANKGLTDHSSRGTAAIPVGGRGS